MARRTAALLAAALLAGCPVPTEEEVRCEEAMARVLDCCAGVTRSPVTCEWARSPVSPYLWSFPQVDCLVDRSCGELESSGACAWAAAGAVTEICP
jgi:hypothetical protein